MATHIHSHACRNHQKGVGVLCEIPHKGHHRQIQPLALAVAIGVQEHDSVGRNLQVGAQTGLLTRRQTLEQRRIHTVLQDIHRNRLVARVLNELLLPALRKDQKAVGILFHILNQAPIVRTINLVQVDPHFERLGLLGVQLQGLQEPVHHQGIIVDHHNVGLHHIHILLELVETKSLLARLLVQSRIILNHTCWENTQGLVCARHGSLKPKMIDLQKRLKRGELLQQIVAHLGIPRHLLGVRADQQKLQRHLISPARTT